MFSQKVRIPDNIKPWRVCSDTFGDFALASHFGKLDRESVVAHTIIDAHCSNDSGLFVSL